MESRFPGVERFDDVTTLTEELFKQLSLRYSQSSMVLIGAGPPCQGVSGLNADRRGALKDAGSSLFVYVEQVRSHVRRFFTWCPCYTFDGVWRLDGRQGQSSHVGILR